MQKSMVMLEKSDNRAPDDYMQLVLKEYNTCWGMLTIDQPDLTIGSIAGRDTSPLLVDINEVREVCNDPPIPIAYWFCKDDKLVHADSMQPFTVAKDKDENPLVVALAAGEFKSHKSDGEGISNAAYYITEFLNPQFEDLLERTDGDIEKLDTLLIKKAVMSNLQNSLGEGDYLILVLNDTKKSVHVIPGPGMAVNAMDWGFTSDTLGWEKTEYTTTDTKVEENAPVLTGAAARLAAKRAKDAAKLGSTEKSTASSSVTTFVPTPSVVVNKTQDLEMKPPRGATPDTHPQWFYRLDPDKASSMKDKHIRQAYQDACGHVPNDYKDTPYVLRKKPKSVSTEPLKDFSGLKQIANVIPAKSKGEGAPIIPQQSLKHINEIIVPKYYDVSSRLIKSPWEAPRVEDKIPFLSELTGLGDALYGAPVALRKELITNPDALINWTIEMSAKIIEQRKEINELRAKLAEAGGRIIKSA